MNTTLLERLVIYLMTFTLIAFMGCQKPQIKYNELGHVKSQSELKESDKSVSEESKINQQPQPQRRYVYPPLKRKPYTRFTRQA